MLTISWTGGSIISDTTWFAANGTYDLSGSVYVQSGATLTIEPGVQVQGSALYVNSNGTGGSLVAPGVNFTDDVYLNANATANLSGSRFVTTKIHVDAQLASSLAGSIFQPNSTVDILGGNFTSSATLPSISNVNGYYLEGWLYVQSGATLTINSPNTISGSALDVNSNGTGGSLVAPGVNFTDDVYLNANATANLTGSRFVTTKIHVDAQLASSLAGSIFQPNSTVDILGGNLTNSATLPSISNVNGYYLEGWLYVQSGATLTINSPNTISGSALDVNSNGTGGSLVAPGVNFTNDVYLNANATANLSGSRFVTTKIHVDAQLASSLAGSIFQPNSTVDILGGNFTSSATLPSISNVNGYYLEGWLYVQSGATLTINSPNTISGSALDVNSNGTGGSLVAPGVNFTDDVYLNANATANLTGSRFVTTKIHVDAQLASSLAGSIFQPNSTVDILGGNLTSSATLPSISNVNGYYLEGWLYVQSGATLTINSPNTISGSALDVNSNDSGGSLVAVGVTFSNQLVLGARSAGILEFDKFTYAGYNYFDGYMAAIVTDNDFSASKAEAQGTVGLTVNLKGNYWGTTDVAVIGQTRIYDHADSTFLPVIDFSSPLLAPPVPPAEAWQRQVYKLSTATFDGPGNDINLWLGDVIAGQQVQVYVGQTLEDLHSIGTFTNSGTSPWFVSLDIHAANPSLAEAEYVAVGSDKPVIILSAVGLHPNPTDLSESGYQQYPAITGSQPQPQVNDYTNVAQLYRWNWDSPNPSFVPMLDSQWPTIDWSKPTIILTHGWNDSLDISTNGLDTSGNKQFIWTFAETFRGGRTLDQCKAFNILAVDWNDGGSKNDSDPDNNPSDFLNIPDAEQSAANGVAAAYALAGRLVAKVGSNLSPQNMMLVGHSNGAGFMGSLALSLHSMLPQKQKIAELVALDAPTLTPAWVEVKVAAASVARVSNYYMPGWWNLGFGAAIDDISNLYNFSLDKPISDDDLRQHGIVGTTDYFGHIEVAERYAESAGVDATWGFQTSKLMNSSDPYKNNSYWVEELSQQQDVFVPVARSELSGEELKAEAQAAFATITRTVYSILEPGVRVAQDVSQVLKGVVNDATLWSTGLANSLLLHFQAHSPVYGSIDVNMPSDADLLTFNLSVANPGNSGDHLLVMIGDDVVQDIDLASVQSVGGVTEQVWVNNYAGQAETVQFYMPSPADVSSSAEFSISNVNFVAVNFPPVASWNPNGVAIDDSTATFTVTYTDPDDSVLYSTIDGNDILVTGPNGFSHLAALVTVDQPGDGSTRTATYRITAPGGAWTPADSGTYTAIMQANQVIDTSGNYVASGALGAFTVNVAPPTLTTISTLAGATEDTPFTISYATLAAAADEADVDGDPISFRVESVSSGTLTKSGVAVVPGTTLLSTAESLVWTPASNLNGTLNAFTVKAFDGALASSTAVQVKVSVAAINDVPSFTAGGNRSVLEDAGRRASLAGPRP